MNIACNPNCSPNHYPLWKLPGWKFLQLFSFIYADILSSFMLIIIFFPKSVLLHFYLTCFRHLFLSGHTVLLFLFHLKVVWDSLSPSPWPSLDSCSFPISRAVGLMWPRFLPQCHFCSFCVLNRTQGEESSSGVQFSLSVKVIEASISMVLTVSQHSAGPVS